MVSNRQMQTAVTCIVNTPRMTITTSGMRTSARADSRSCHNNGAITPCTTREPASAIAITARSASTAKSPIVALHVSFSDRNISQNDILAMKNDMIVLPSQNLRRRISQRTLR